MILLANQSLGILLTLFVMMAAAKVLAEIFERLRQPAIVGEILAGILIGPGVLELGGAIRDHKYARRSWRDFFAVHGGP